VTLAVDRPRLCQPGGRAKRQKFNLNRIEPGRNSPEPFSYPEMLYACDLFRVKISRLSKSTTYKTPMAI
jgi:hypothetical protein